MYSINSNTEALSPSPNHQSKQIHQICENLKKCYIAGQLYCCSNIHKTLNLEKDLRMDYWSIYVFVYTNVFFD